MTDNVTHIDRIRPKRTFWRVPINDGAGCVVPLSVAGPPTQEENAAIQEINMRNGAVNLALALIHMSSLAHHYASTGGFEQVEEIVNRELAGYVERLTSCPR